jgi:hypothetical protein
MMEALYIRRIASSVLLVDFDLVSRKAGLFCYFGRNTQTSICSWLVVCLSQGDLSYNLHLMPPMLRRPLDWHLYGKCSP